ncbi:two-component system response regulator YesN [Breznakia blatticola]|uniref:Two-component system response regulator YesN n=1 Tax=Breznakia blatticola TaxID=1754012 RepID=A0A4R8AC61_9FIRM|nr:response regulator [Breznakia blatticola]TDW26090.1 two-component system response regulator YesN [Breznakia blatticola]
MYTVVIADDEYELRQALVHTIDWNRLGFEVIGEAENGAVALELVERLQPDLLITDIQMPFISGIELARQARNIRPYMNIVFISGYDDFSYAQQAIQYNIISYLLKPLSSSEIEIELVKIREKIDERFDLLRGSTQEDQSERIQHLKINDFLMSHMLYQNHTFTSLDDEQAIKQEAMNLNLTNSISMENYYQTMVLTFMDEDKQNQTQEKHVKFTQGILGKYLLYGSFYSRKKIVVVVSGTTKELERSLPIITTEFVQSAKRILNFDCEIGVSQPYNNWLDLSKSYDEALFALRFSQQEEPIQYASDISKLTKNDFAFVRQSVEELEHLVKVGTPDAINDFVKQVLMKPELMQEHSLDMFTLQIFAALSKAITAVASNEETEQFLSYVYGGNINGTSGRSEQIKDKILKVSLEAHRIIMNQRKEASELLAQSALDLIKNQYHDEDMSIAKASQLLHVSASYLSAIIKKNTNSTFGTLLTERRMHKAKELLLSTSNKIMEIANACGYSDTHYFSYCVKRYYGDSPNKLREMQREANHEVA